MAIIAGRLSGGTRQKLNLVLASLGDPDLLLLDEPYQGFDRGTYLDLWDHVWRWRDRGKAVVVVTHLLEPRLRLAGYSTVGIYLGRTAALVLAGLVLATPYLLLVAADQDLARGGALALALGLTALVAAPLGMLLGSVLARDMEGVLLLLGVVAAQFLIDPERLAGRLMPFWSARELGTYVVDSAGGDYLRRGLVHGLAAATVLFGVAAMLAARRLRRRVATGRPATRPA